MEIDGEDDDLFRCALCGTSESDASNLTTQSALQTNATVGCGHQFCNCLLYTSDAADDLRV